MAKISIDLGDGKKATVEVSTLAQEDTLQRLLKVMDSTGKAGTLNTQNSQRAINDLGDAASASVDALEELPTSFEDASDAVEEAAGNMRDASAKFKKDLSSSMFTNTKSLFSGMSSPMEFLKDSTKSVGDGFKGLLTASSKSGGAMAGFSGGMLRMLGPIGLAFSALSAALGFLVGRAKKNIEMYDNSLKAGAVFAGGLEEFRDTVTTSSLNLDDFNSVVTKNAGSFSFFGGSVAAGAKKFAAVSSEVGKYGVQFKNLGYSQEEMANVQAEYMEQLARTNSLTGERGKSDAAVAQGAVGYAANLKLMSSLTGKSVEQLKAEQLARSKDFRVQMAAKAMAVRKGISEADAMANIQNSLKMAPESMETILAQAAGTTSVAAAKEAALFSSKTQALLAMMEAEAAAKKAGITDEAEILRIRMAAGQKYTDGMAKELELNSTAGAVGRASIQGQQTALTEQMNAGYEGSQNFLTMVKGGPEAVAALEKKQKDQTSTIAQQNAIATDLYNAQRNLLNMTDQLAIGGMKALQDAFLKFAIYLYKIIPGLGKMSPSLKAAADALEAETIAADKKAKADTAVAAAKVAEAKTGAMDPAAIAAVTKTVMQAGMTGFQTTKQAGLFGTSDKIERKEGESDEDYNKRNLDEIRKALLAKSADPKMASNIKMDLTSQLLALKSSETGKGMTDAELAATLTTMYKQQGMLISENFDKVTAMQANATTKPEKYAEGGIASGARSGFDAILHGTEAVVPLPDNKTIPVSLMGGATGSSDLGPTMSQVKDLLQMQNALLSELIDHTRNSVKVQKNIRDLNY